ncbi:hypothetical protein POM88_033712 [Heracleum sosnowskyi]|uniref:Uncharacterized protein n=1 Tax=Heracleum sosnowskyi TaxID=360622 RepID=A0AAD8M9W4_9APIA|nr:hypothetical protein POM88_033712 [Heracleum sosnowskyi]
MKEANYNHLKLDNFTSFRSDFGGNLNTKKTRTVDYIFNKENYCPSNAANLSSPSSAGKEINTPGTCNFYDFSNVSITPTAPQKINRVPLSNISNTLNSEEGEGSNIPGTYNSYNFSNVSITPNAPKKMNRVPLSNISNTLNSEKEGHSKKYGVGENYSSVVIEHCKTGNNFPNNQKVGQLVIVKSTNKQETQLHSEVVAVIGSGEGEGAQRQISELKEELFCITDKDVKMIENQNICSTDPQQNINKGFHDVLEGFYLDKEGDMVKQSVNIGSQNGIVLVDRIVVKCFGVAGRKWQNYVSFSIVLNANGFEGGGHDSLLQEGDPMAI